mmetsp:Transcript_5485/g.7536  ORF Transcript_5485/g.7536 Transcript_5485/m.7536 type:complete len:829 (-) Transcript_5485:334-2820(-)
MFMTIKKMDLIISKLSSTTLKRTFPTSGVLFLQRQINNSSRLLSLKIPMKQLFKFNAQHSHFCSSAPSLIDKHTSSFGVHRAVMELQNSSLGHQMTPKEIKEFSAHLSCIRSSKDFEKAVDDLSDQFPLFEVKALRQVLWTALCNAGYVDTAFAIAGDLAEMERKHLSSLLKGCLYARPPRLSEGLDLVERLKQMGLKSAQWRLVFQLLGFSADPEFSLESRLRADIPDLESLAKVTKNYWYMVPEEEAGAVMSAYVKAQADIASAVGLINGKNDTKNKELEEKLWKECLQILSQLVEDPSTDKKYLGETVASVICAAIQCRRSSEFNTLWDTLLQKALAPGQHEATFLYLKSTFEGIYRGWELRLDFCSGLFPILSHILQDDGATSNTGKALQIKVLALSRLDSLKKLELFRDITEKVDDSSASIKNAILLFRATTSVDAESLEVATLLLEGMVSQNIAIEPTALHELYHSSGRLNFVDAHHLSRLDRAVKASSKKSMAALWGSVHRAQMLARLKANDPYLAVYHAKALRKMHFPLGMQPCLALLHGIVKGDARWKKTRDLMRDPNDVVLWCVNELLKQNLQPNAKFLNIGLNCYASALGMTNETKGHRFKILPQALEFLELLSPGSNAHINSSEGSKDFKMPDWASDIKPVKMNQITYNTLVKVFCKAGQISRALELLKAMRQAGFPPNEVTYNQMIRTLAVHKTDFWAAEEILVLMGNEGIPITSRTMDAFLEGFLRAKKTGKGISMAQHMFNQYQVRPHPQQFLKLINAELQKGDQFEARRAWIVCEQLWPVGNGDSMQQHHTQPECFKKEKMEKLFQQFGFSL